MRLIVATAAALAGLCVVGALLPPAGAGASSPPPTPAPANAIVLFDGTSTDQWIAEADGKPCPWKVVDGGAMEVGGGSIVTKRKFDDLETLHVEFWLPANPPDVKGQARSNSGVKLQQRYEIQVLDSHGREPTKGDCGAVYNKKPPDVNACAPAGTWQTFDITYKAPRFDAAGRKTANAAVTVFHNGKKVHDNVEVDGPTRSGETFEGPGPLPIALQDHGNPVRYRNIWVVPAAAADAAAAAGSSK